MKPLTQKQSLAWYFLNDNRTREILYGGAAGGGKSYLGCFWIIHNALKFPRTRYVIGRKKLSNLELTTKRTFFEILDIIQHTYNLGQFWKYDANKHIVTFNNRSEVIFKDLFLYPADPEFDGLGSLELTGAFVDECNQVVEKAKVVLASRIRYKLDEYDLMPKLLLSCNPSKGWVHQVFYKPWTDRLLPVHRKFVPAKLEDNPHISRHYESQLMMGDAATIRRLRYGEWDYDDDEWKLFLYDALSDMFTNTFMLDPKARKEMGLVEKIDDHPDHDRYITADVARFGQDTTVVTVWYGWVCRKVVQVKKWDTTKVESLITTLAAQHRVARRNIVIDEDGIGSGVLDHLPGAIGFLNAGKPINDENFNSLKSQCYFKLAEHINSNKIFVEDPELRDPIIEELAIIRQSHGDKDGKKSIEGKEKQKEILGRSPDLADAIMMRMRLALKRFTGNYDLSV